MHKQKKMLKISKGTGHILAITTWRDLVINDRLIFVLRLVRRPIKDDKIFILSGNNFP